MFPNTQNRSFNFMLFAVTILQTSIIFSLHLVNPVDSATALEEIEENPGKKTKKYLSNYKSTKSLISLKPAFQIMFLIKLFKYKYFSTF